MFGIHILLSTQQTLQCYYRMFSSSLISWEYLLLVACLFLHIIIYGIIFFFSAAYRISVGKAKLSCADLFAYFSFSSSRLQYIFLYMVYFALFSCLLCLSLNCRVYFPWNRCLSSALPSTHNEQKRAQQLGQTGSKQIINIVDVAPWTNYQKQFS